jgi:signal transduction histidine kinase
MVQAAALLGIGSGVVGVLLLGEAAIAWLRREAPPADLFAVTACVTGCGALLIAINTGLGMRRMLQLSAVVIALLMPLPWLLFTFKYTGRTEMRAPGIATIIGAVPLLGLGATVIITGSQLLPGVTLPSPGAARGIAAVVVTVLVLVQWTAVVYAGGLIVIGSGFLLSTFRRYEHLDWRIGLSLGLFGTLPWLSLLLGLQVATTGAFGLPTAVFWGFGIGTVATANALLRYDMFRVIPAAGNVGPETIVEDLDDLVVVTDDDGRILKINAAVERRLEIDRGSVAGGDLVDLLGSPLADLADTDAIELRTNAGKHSFEPTVSRLTDQHDKTLGHAVTLRDVTVRNTRQQRLAVLNRVLRHNLRNDMTTIRLRAEILRDHVQDSELVESAEIIVDRSDRLTSLSEKARELEGVMENDEHVTVEVPVDGPIEDVRREVTNRYPSATVEADVSSNLVIEADRDLLEQALSDLVENAIEHNDRDEPWVRLRARYEPDWTYPLTLSVIDDGPGIPETERTVILGGEEAPLQHASGLGLWTVRWAVTQLGGELDIDDREPRGSVVSLHLPRTRRTDETSEKSIAGTHE